jgi:hypothetical protein
MQINIFQINLLILSILLTPGCNSESNKMGPPAPGYSATIDESKTNGVFQYEVVADKSNLTLDSNLKIEIKKAWVENSWFKQVLMFGKSPIEKNDSDYQLILNLKIDSLHNENASNYFYFIGNKHLDTFTYYYCHNYYSNRIDSIKIPLYKEISNELPSRKERKAFDTITFVKRKDRQ